MNPSTSKLYTGEEPDFKELLRAGEIIPVDDGRTAGELVVDRLQVIKEAKNRAKRERKKRRVKT